MQAEARQFQVEGGKLAQCSLYPRLRNDSIIGWFLWHYRFGVHTHSRLCLLQLCYDVGAITDALAWTGLVLTVVVVVVVATAAIHETQGYAVVNAGQHLKVGRPISESYYMISVAKKKNKSVSLSVKSKKY